MNPKIIRNQHFFSLGETKIFLPVKWAVKSPPQRLFLPRTLHLFQKREEKIIKHTELLGKHTKELIFLLEHNEIRIMKLVNRKVLTEHDVIEMQRRATKKAETTK